MRRDDTPSNQPGEESEAFPPEGPAADAQTLAGHGKPGQSDRLAAAERWAKRIKAPIYPLRWGAYREKYHNELDTAADLHGVTWQAELQRRVRDILLAPTFQLLWQQLVARSSLAALRKGRLSNDIRAALNKQLTEAILGPDWRKGEGKLVTVERIEDLPSTAPAVKRRTAKKAEGSEALHPSSSEVFDVVAEKMLEEQVQAAVEKVRPTLTEAEERALDKKLRGETLETRDYEPLNRVLAKLGGFRPSKGISVQFPLRLSHLLGQLLHFEKPRKSKSVRKRKKR